MFNSPRFLMVFTLGAMFMWSASVGAQTFSPASNQNFALDLDTGDEHFSNWNDDDLGSISGLKATMEVDRLGKGPKWLPTFLIAVTTKEGSFGLKLLAEQWKPPIAAYTIVQSKNANAIDQQIAVGQKIDLEMDWSMPGKLIFHIDDGKSVELGLPGPVTGIRISASTGELKVSSLALGHFTH
jgi:hypothetical protein